MVILSAASGSLLVWVMAEDLLAVGALDLFLGGLVTVLLQTENSIVVLTLPVLGLTKEELFVLLLTDLARVIILDLLDVLFGLDTVVFREGTLMASSAGMSQEVRSDRLYMLISGCY